MRFAEQFARMTALPARHVAAARRMFAAGWRALDPIGRVEPPLGVQASAAQWTDDWTWQALALMGLAAAAGVTPITPAAPRLPHNPPGPLPP